MLLMWDGRRHGADVIVRGAFRRSGQLRHPPAQRTRASFVRTLLPGRPTGASGTAGDVERTDTANPDVAAVRRRDRGLSPEHRPARPSPLQVEWNFAEPHTHERSAPVSACEDDMESIS